MNRNDTELDMKEGLAGLAARENQTERKGGLFRRVRRFIRVSRAVTPEFFDLKDTLTKACLDGEISSEEIVSIKQKITSLLMAIESAKEEEREE